MKVCGFCVHYYECVERCRTAHTSRLTPDCVVAEVCMSFESIDAEPNIPFEDKSEFTDKEILNSLYTCSRHGCIGCSLKGHDHCITQLLTLAIELIQRQQKEINNAKSYKEFAKKVATDVAMTEKEKKI